MKKYIHNYRSVIIGFILNLIFLIISEIISINLGMSIILLSMYLIPILLNFLGIVLARKGYNKRNILYLSLITTIFYILYSQSLMHTSGFKEFIKKYSYSNGDAFIEVNPNFVSLPQIIFVFLLHFCVVFILCKLFLERDDENARNK
ncbi:Msa family membrane protein [Staphylococcus hominis]|uniref:Msa family membrane protein n=1 Tax=Staphylococcus hominis TaxID=1290 RepID=UPI000DFA6D63|nr:Msa family membrane protein [Staphylococcus hominis]SUM64220.1 Uncharacterised protein [Staphylococcus hominis]